MPLSWAKSLVRLWHLPIRLTALMLLAAAIDDDGVVHFSVTAFVRRRTAKHWAKRSARSAPIRRNRATNRVTGGRVTKAGSLLPKSTTVTVNADAYTLVDGVRCLARG